MEEKNWYEFYWTEEFHEVASFYLTHTLKFSFEVRFDSRTQLWKHIQVQFVDDGYSTENFD